MEEMKNNSSHRLDMEAIIGFVLQTGLFLSLGFLLSGLGWHFIRFGNLQFNYQISSGTLWGLWRDNFHLFFSAGWRPRLLINMGMAILITTPFVRVLVSFLYFCFIQQNVKYTLFTLFVLLALTYNLI